MGMKITAVPTSRASCELTPGSALHGHIERLVGWPRRLRIRNGCVAKDPATLRAKGWRTAGGVASQSQSAPAMLLRRALPAARQDISALIPYL